MTRPCSVEVCDREAKIRGWCKYHYEWWRKKKEIPTHAAGDMRHLCAGDAWPAEGSSKNWTRENLAWAAGFIDADGCIEVKNKGKGEIGLSAFQKDKELLERLQYIFGVGSLYERRSSSNPGGHPDGCLWRVNRKQDVYAILVALYPWFSKRRQKKVREAIQRAFPKEEAA